MAAPKPASKSCCMIYSLDPSSMQLSPLIEPAQAVTVASDRVLVQRGNTGVDCFDSSTLLRLPVIKAPGVYRFSPSADGRLAFGISTYPQPSLDLFDLVQGALMTRHFLAERPATSAWIGTSFWFYIKMVFTRYSGGQSPSSPSACSRAVLRAPIMKAVDTSPVR